MADTNGHDEPRDRLSDLERLTESLAAANKHMLTAQVLIHDRQDVFEKQMLQLIERQGHTDTQIASLATAQKDQGERLDKLVSAIGELIQRIPRARMQ